MFRRGLLFVCLLVILGLSSHGARVVSATAVQPTGLTSVVLNLQGATPALQTMPSVVIIGPSPNDQFEFGQPVTVISKSVDPQGVARVELRANGRVVAIQSNPQPQPNQALLVNQFWTPTLVGNQIIQVVAYNTAGVAGESEFVFVQVVSAAPTATPTPSNPSVTVTGVEALRVRQGPGTAYGQLGYLLKGQSAVITGRNNVGAELWWQIQYPSSSTGFGWISGSPTYVTADSTENVPVVVAPPLPTPAPTPTPPPPPPVQSDFWVDLNSIRRGECVTFYWNVSGVRAVYFEDKGVAGENQSRQECPRDDKTFHLRIERTDGAVKDKYIQIDVRDSGTGFDTITVAHDTKMDFDNGGQKSSRDNEFRWKFEGDRPVFEKVDNDDDDVRLVPLEIGNNEEFNELSKDTCRWYLNRDNKRKITINLNLIVCFSTDKDRTGKLRFTGGNRNEAIIQWHVW